MIASTPTIIDGVSYPLYEIRLAISSQYLGTGGADANIALNLIPCRIEDGEVSRRDDRAKPVFLGSLAGTSQATVDAVAAVTAALQTYITEEGL